jgi:hypothetical protein
MRGSAELAEFSKLKIMKDGQQIIFKHPDDGRIYSGFVTGMSVSYRHGASKFLYPAERIKEWADAEAAFNAFSLQLIRAGNFG